VSRLLLALPLLRCFRPLPTPVVAGPGPALKPPALRLSTTVQPPSRISGRARRGTPSRRVPGEDRDRPSSSPRRRGRVAQRDRADDLSSPPVPDGLPGRRGPRVQAGADFLGFVPARPLAKGDTTLSSRYRARSPRPPATPLRAGRGRRLVRLHAPRAHRRAPRLPLLDDRRFKVPWQLRLRFPRSSPR